MVFIQIAWNNLLRNYRRTVSAVMAVVVGVGVIVFINGFNDGLIFQFSHHFINGTNGHFKIRHADYAEYIETDMQKILMNDPQRLKDELKKNPHVVEAIMRIPLAGLIGDDEKSTTCYGHAYEMDGLTKVLPLSGEFVVEGKDIEPGDPMGAVLGKALAESLNAKIGDELVIIGNSIHAEQNAILVYVKGLFEIPGSKEMEANMIVTSIDQVQNDLLDLNSAATDLLVRIDDEKHLAAVVAWVNDHFAEMGEPWVAMPWYDDPQFGQGMGLLNGISTLIGVVLSLLVGIVISNTLLMSVFERIREIGTIRAVGAEKGHIYKIFYAESVITIFMGVLLGLAAGILLTWISGRIGIDVPGLTRGVKIYPAIEMTSLIHSAAIPFIFAAIAVLYPIRFSCKKAIVDALNFR